VKAGSEKSEVCRSISLRRGWPILLAAHKATFCSNLIGGMSGKYVQPQTWQPQTWQPHVQQPQILLKFYRGYYNHTAALNWRRYQPM